MAIDLSELNQRFGIPGRLRFATGQGGLPWAMVSGAAADASICLQGGQLVDWTPRGQQPVIWLSPAAVFAAGAPIRGGTPVCWPWFGPHPAEPGFPAHGFARISLWQVIATTLRESGAIDLVFRLVPDQSAHAWWPHATRLEIHLTVGETLETELVCHNSGAEPVTITQALHTYFRVGDVRRIKLLGLEGCPYLDKTDDGRRKIQEGPVSVSSEVDRIYLGVQGDCLIDDPLMGRRIRIGKRGSASTVVWNPWAEKSAQIGDMDETGYLGMVCVETANAAEDAAIIPAGGEHRLWTRYGVESG